MSAINIRQLPPELEKKARDELNENPRHLQEDLQHLKEWISKQPHLRARTDDQWLVSFLRGCKFSLERAKTKLDLYYTLRTTASDIVSRIKPSDPKFMEILELGFSLVLPKSSDPTVPRIMMVRPGAYDPDKYSLEELMCVYYHINQILINDDDTAIVVGSKTVLDLEGMSLRYLTRVSPTLMKKLVVLGQDSMPLRLRGAHYINIPSGFDTFFSFMRGFLNEKAKKRTVIHKNVSELYEHIPKEILPAEYGGKAGTVKEITEYWKRKVGEYGPWLEQDAQFGTDESRRPGAPKTAETMFGLQGSFRQLEFD